MSVSEIVGESDAVKVGLLVAVLVGVTVGELLVVLVGVSEGVYVCAQAISVS